MHSGLLLLELLRRSGPTGALLTHNLCSSLLLARRVLRSTDGSQRLRGEREVREGRGKRDGRVLGASRCFRFCSAVGVWPRNRSAQRKNWWKLTLPVHQTGRSDTAPQSQLLRLLRLLLWCCVLSGEWCLVLGVRRSAAAALLVVLLVRHGPAEEAREEAVRHEGQVVAGVGLAQEVDHHHLQGDSSGPGEGGGLAQEVDHQSRCAARERVGA